MSAVIAAFSQRYGEARAKFLDAAAAAGLRVHSHPHPLTGHDGEALAMDVARHGAAEAQRVLVLTSACHGVEGFCGSGIQASLLADHGLHDAARRADVAILYVHALNPHGFSWWRRVTHEGVDLNRNFRDFGAPLPHNAAYDEIAAWLLPETWPPTPDNEAKLHDYAATHGERALQQAVSGGQYAHPMGLFFGGHAPTWSNLTLRAVLREHGARCKRLGWIDLHTGLGPSGHGERIFACRDDALSLARARAWWGPHVTSIYDGSSTSALLSGLMWLAAYEECAQTEYTGIALEYGTEPLAEVVDALRGDHWLALHPNAAPALREAIRRRMRDAFYTDTGPWKERVVAQAHEAVQQALRGLAS
jgi:hypothetical protein